METVLRLEQTIQIPDFSYVMQAINVQSVADSETETTSPEKLLKDNLETYYPRIYRAVAAYTNGTGLDPADITQDTFLKAFRKADTFQGSSSVYTWLFRIARNTSIDAMRKLKSVTGTVIDSNFDERLYEQGLEQEPFEQKEENKLLRKALSLLDEDLKMLIILKDLQGMKYHEISEVMDLNEGTVKSRLFRGRLQLKQEMIKLGYRP